jgi:hypothetical protein
MVKKKSRTMIIDKEYDHTDDDDDDDDGGWMFVVMKVILIGYHYY